MDRYMPHHSIYTRSYIKIVRFLELADRSQVNPTPTNLLLIVFMPGLHNFMRKNQLRRVT